MMTWILIGGLAAIALLVGLAIYAAYRAGREDGYEEGRGDRLEERAEEQKAGRHRMSQPRASTSPAPAAVTPDPKPGPAQPSGGAIGVFLARNYRAARGVDTVLLAPQPSPHLTGAADTGTMTRVHLPADVTDTGELRAIEAIGDKLVEQIERGQIARGEFV